MYRRTVISRCKALSYLDDRPIFEEERKATGAWAVGGLPAEREERRRQREEKDLAHRRNLDHMMSLMKKEKITRTVDGFNNPLPEVAYDDDDDGRFPSDGDAKMSEQAERLAREKE